MELTQKVMDKMLESGKTQNHLDTGWTLAPENGEKTRQKKDAANAASSINPSHKNTR